MENKINIAELLKDCPQGMELDCTIFDNVLFERVDFSLPNYPIVLKRAKEDINFFVTKYGQCCDSEDCKCAIFPKGKNTWDGFVPPVEFEDGDILVHGDTVFIYNGVEDDLSYGVYVIIDSIGIFAVNTFTKKYVSRFATEKEKQKLFDAIKDNGYRWNAETKTLEELVEPKFKVGDNIREKDDKSATFTISDIDDSCYYCGDYVICNICDQDNWELVPNKFDITALKPFDKVLVRDAGHQQWVNSFYGLYNKHLYMYFPFICCNGNSYKQCIPYEGNEHLLGTTNDCDEYYKTWEK